jgi:hypothetical protein
VANKIRFKIFNNYSESAAALTIRDSLVAAVCVFISGMHALLGTVSFKPTMRNAEMPLPKDAAEAIKMGLRRLTDDEVAALDRSQVTPGDPNIEQFLCYNGPCSNGKRTICYNSGNGCNECFETSEGC